MFANRAQQLEMVIGESQGHSQVRGQCRGLCHLEDRVRPTLIDEVDDGHAITVAVTPQVLEVK